MFLLRPDDISVQATHTHTHKPLSVVRVPEVHTLTYGDPEEGANINFKAPALNIQIVLIQT